MQTVVLYNFQSNRGNKEKYMKIEFTLDDIKDIDDCTELYDAFSDIIKGHAHSFDNSIFKIAFCIGIFKPAGKINPYCVRSERLTGHSFQ